MGLPARTGRQAQRDAAPLGIVGLVRAVSAGCRTPDAQRGCTPPVETGAFNKMSGNDVFSGVASLPRFQRVLGDFVVRPLAWTIYGCVFPGDSDIKLL